MGKLNIDFNYVGIEKAAALLGVSVADLIHAGAFDQLQICVNIYARAASVWRRRIDENLIPDERELSAIELAEAKAHIEKWGDWLTRLKSNLMPAGVFEIGTEDLRLFEMPEVTKLELVDGFKSDDIGLWEVEFPDPVKIKRTDLVILASEIARIQKLGGVIINATDKHLTPRERTTYLNIIGALLEQLTDGKANNTTVINQALQKHGTKPGISKRKLEEVLAAARRCLSAS
jgi:hypothetical protein